MLPFFILVNLTISDFSVPKLKIALDLAFSLLSNYMKHVKAWREEKSFGCFKFNKSLLSISDIWEHTEGHYFFLYLLFLQLTNC